jgi:hypothetical protein
MHNPPVNIEKFDSRKHERNQFDIPFTYYSHELMLDLRAYIIKRNDEIILVTQNAVSPHKFPAFFLPRRKSNWQNLCVEYATKEDLTAIEKEKIEIYYEECWGKEYFYKTKTLTDPKGTLRKRINRFKRLYEYNILQEYPEDKITAFYYKWKEQRDRSGLIFKQGERDFLYTLKNLYKYNVKQVYVEIEQKLVGFAWAVRYDANHCIGLHLKSDYEYKELSRFLHYEQAKLFSECEYLTLGDDASEEGLATFKYELGPYKELPYYYIETGEREE